MNDIISIRGIVATIPRHLVTGTGLSITSFRLASPSRRWDRSTSAWTNGDTNWFTVTAFRTLATNVQESVVKGDRVLVTGRLRIRPWEGERRSGISVEIDADAVGHDLAFGRSQWRKVLRHTIEETAGPGEHPTEEERAAARRVADGTAVADPETGELIADTDLETSDTDDGTGPGSGPSGPATMSDGRAGSGLTDTGSTGTGLEDRIASASSAAVGAGERELDASADHVDRRS
ncbi:single-stranded DNA-binding protein [Curtobacterium sp. RRHDQ10]|uniref:single-stranded DNA-binding protein n=1 Tax=Curtobacterium phyllosphaerae TaxID=3413379 RepID=UPI003BEF833A